MYFTLQEKKEYLSKYSGKTSDDLYVHLRRHFPITEYKYDWSSEPIKFIKVDDKVRPIKDNKKYLVGYISSMLENEWVSIGIPTLRRTIKKYIDAVSI